MNLDTFLQRLPAVRRSLLEICSPDSCIETSRVVQLLLRGCGIEAKPIPVQVLVYNKAAWELVQRGDMVALAKREGGAYLVNVGNPAHQAMPGKWAGHLAILAAGKLIDATIDQASRPQHGILLDAPVAFDAPRDFLQEGAVLRRMNDHGVCLEYIHHPQNLGYRSTPAWRKAPLLLRTARRALREAGRKPAGPDAVAGPRRR